MKPALSIAFFGSSLVSAYWNGAATYYRGIIKGLHALGHDITFYEPDAFERQQHRDIEDPDYAKVVVYPPTLADMKRVVKEGARQADILIKASGVGVLDRELEEAVITEAPEETTVAFWDVDAPATLSCMETHSENLLRRLLPHYDLILTYGGGEKVVERYRRLGAANCTPVYNALDPDTHFPVAPTTRFQCDLAFLGNRLPDREERVEEFFLKPATLRPDRSFILGGNGWESKSLPANVRCIGHVYTQNHNALNCSATIVLNINRESMASNGFSPATRIFEAAGAGACILTDYWEGIETFFDPSSEMLTVNSGEEVAAMLDEMTEEKAAAIGKAAYRRVLHEHTYSRRAQQVETLLLTHVARYQHVQQ